MANSDISKIKLPNNDELTIKDGQAVKAIERNGTTFTATKRDGTTFTFTQQDNNNAVTQTISSTDNKEYRVLLSGTADDTTRTEGARKGTNFRYNPSTDNLIIGKINGSALGTAAYKNITDTYSATGTDAVSGKAVKAALDTLPSAMVFKGSLGTGGTITTLPVDGTANVGDTYKVITAGTYAGQAADVGDLFTCLTKTASANTWEYFPSGDESSGTVTSVTIKATSPIAIDSSSAITTSGTRTLSHANSGVTAGTYRSVTVNTTGHVTAGTNPTTLSGYGITDAKISGGVITLGSNTMSPVTSATLGTNGNNVTLTVNSGSAQSITVPYATTAGSANTAKAVLTAGGDVIMGTTGSDFDDSGDIVWKYGNGNEKARLYTANEYTAKSGLNYRVCKKDGTPLYIGTIPLSDGTGASGTWSISITGSAGSATSATTASKLSANAGSGTNPVYFTGGIPTVCTYSLNKTVPADAVFTDVNVKVNNTNTTTGAWYYPVWYTLTSGTGNVNANDGFRHFSLQGTASVTGQTILSLGNGTATGTAGNKYGELRIYAEKTGYATIKMTASADDIEAVQILPSTSGTILNTGTTSFTQSLTSGTKIGTIKINGTSTDLYCQTNTNTTYTIGTNGNTITLTPSSGSAQSITAPYATSAGSATKATQDGSGNVITSTYVKKSGDTMTGGLTINTANQYSQLTLHNEGSTANNYPTKLSFENQDTTTGYTSYGYIKCYKGNKYTTNMVITPGCDMFIGSGSAAEEHCDLYAHDTSENFYATAEYSMYLQADANTIANRRGMMITTSHEIVPCKADVPTDGIGCIGSTNYKWGHIYANHFIGNASTATSAETATKANQDSDGNTINSTYLKRSGGTLTGRLTASKTICNVVTGSGAAAQDKGSGVSPRYFPAKWTYNTGLTAIDGDRLVVKIPVAGHDYGVYLSIDNGTKYYPVVANGTGRITTHYPNGTYIMVVFESGGSAASMFPLNGGDSRTTVTGGVWRVINYYDANSNVTQTATTGNANYEVLFSNTADNTSRTESARKSNAFIFNPTTGLKLGVSSQSAFPTLGIDVHDVRSVNFTPGALDKGANFFFSNNTMPNTNWWSGLHVKGWTGAYAAWEIVGSAHNNDSRTTPLYVRSSNTNSVWGSWRKIYDTSNPPTKSEVGLGNVDNTADANKSVSYATTSGTATGANKLNSIAAIGTASQTHAQALKTYFDANKTTVPRNVGINFYSSAYNNGANCFGYFLNGYDDNPYGGFFISHYDKAYYVGINNGNYTQNLLGRFTADPTSGQVVVTDGTTGGIKSSGYTIAKSVPSNAVFTDTNTHRPIQVNGTEILGNNTTALNLKAGSNVSVTNSSGTVTIAATDTNTTYTLSADTTNNKITLTPSSGTAQSITVPYATSAGGVAWGNVTGKPSTFTPASHTHGITDITWAGNANLKANASANNQEWSIDLTPGSYTGTYWQVWSAKNSKTILACYTDNNKVEVPNGDFHVTNGEVSVGYGIELGTASNDAAAHIDFHWNSTGTDYTARIWQRSENTVDLIGKNSSTWGIWRAGSFSSQSSKYVKKNIEDITDAEAEKILQLRPVKFDYKFGGFENQRGFIAEEVNEIMPEMVLNADVKFDENEPWNSPSIDYSKFVPYLVKMIQKQQKQINKLLSR